MPAGSYALVAVPKTQQIKALRHVAVSAHVDGRLLDGSYSIGMMLWHVLLSIYLYIYYVSIYMRCIREGIVDPKPQVQGRHEALRCPIE